jgi:heptose-I-phosphate ethanolaminephosphotransferase
MDQNKGWEYYRYSIIDILNGAGFTTYWFSNNAVMGMCDTLLQVLSRNASSRKFSENRDVDLRSMQGGFITNPNDLQYDSVLLPWLEEALDENITKKAIFLHLKGSHGLYQYRYPASFNYFDTALGIESSDIRSQSNKVEIVNYYDNSIRYTDFIIDYVIKSLESRKERSWVLYFSDHGEDVFDYNEISGRDLEKVNKYMLDVPFIVWFSEEYKRVRETDLYQTYLDRPYRLDDIIYSIMDIAGLKTYLYDPSRSIFSSSYYMRARMCLGKMYLAYPPENLVNPRTVEQESKLMRWLLEGRGDL